MTLYNIWAKAMIFLSRGGRYIAILNTFMLSKIFWETFDNKLLAIGLLILGIIGLISVTTWDYLHVFGRETGVTFAMNHEWIKMKEQLDRIESKLGVKDD